MPSRLLALLAVLAGSAARLEAGFASCALESVAPPVSCGELAVPEAPDAAAAKTLTLRVVVVGARGGERKDDALLYLAGGPGASAIRSVAWVAGRFDALRATRDLVFVDLRGTGDSAPLDCEERKGPRGVQEILDHFFPPGLAAACYARLAERAHLDAYHTDAAVEDLERVREALGYTSWNLVGESYGTRVAQVYLRRHPAFVRTATLLGTLALGEPLPLAMGRDAEAALGALFADCAAEAPCAAAFPDLAGDLARALARLDTSAPVLALAGAAPPAPGQLTLTREAFVQLLRYLLYVPLTAADVPLVLHEAAAGRYDALAAWAIRLAPFLTSVADGFFLSVTCREDLPFAGNSADFATRAEDGWFGDLRLRAQRDACASWPVPAAPADFQTPVATDRPVLFLTGDRDPVTPPRGAELASARLANSRRLTIPRGGHTPVGMAGESCPDEIAMRFVETARLEPLDVSCLQTIKPPAFRLPCAEKEIDPCP